MSAPARRLIQLPPSSLSTTYKEFIPPPGDGSLCLPELWDWQLTHNPSHRFFVYAKDDDTVGTIQWSEALAAVYRGVGILRDRIGWKQGMKDVPIIAILSHSDTIPYTFTIMSGIRAGFCVFPISPRNSPAAIANLMSKTGVNHILVGRDLAMSELVARSLEILREQYPSIPVPNISSGFALNDLFAPGEHAKPEDIPQYEFLGPDTPCLILHSSGSTAHPKPIVWTLHRFTQLGLIPRFGKRDLVNRVLGAHVMPLFHAMGTIQLSWAPAIGIVVGAFESKLPPPIPTPETVFRASKITNIDLILTIPSLIEAWAKKPECVDWLTTRIGVLYGGGPLNKQVGDLLTARGIPNFPLYGSTETGPVTVVLPAKVDEDWDYFEFPSFIETKMVPHGDETYECIIVNNQYCTPGILNTKVDGRDAFSTSDLFLLHPTKPGRWKMLGRYDDQIIHNTGEKTNPIPLESMLNQDSHVKAAVMFGQGQFQVGVLIDPKPQLRFNPEDQTKLSEFRSKIWPTIERVNEFAPQHSRIFKEMILISKPSKPFEYTAKDTARRQAVIRSYEEEISELYKTVEESSQSIIAAPSIWEEETTTKFAREVVRKVMRTQIQDEADLFESGCDSLQATWIRNSLLRGLKETAQIDSRKVDMSFVYSHPSIKNLATYILDIAYGLDEEGNSVGKRTHSMLNMVSKYSGRFPAHNGTIPVPKAEETVFVTGTTGSLGCHILSRLVLDEAITRVYAFNRPSKAGVDIIERQKAALVERGLDSGLVHSRKVVLLEGDLTQERFGLTEERYAEVLKSTTHIIHNAWRVDFNLALESFDSNVRGVRALVDFALSSPFKQPPRLLFESSVGVFRNIGTTEVQLEKPIAAEVAAGTGYSESKWVSEMILSSTRTQTVLDPLILRVGQLCGGPDGAWNTQEWFPSLVQGAQKLRCFPTDSRTVDWIPVDIAAAALVELRNAPADISFVHLIHPRPSYWTFIAQVISTELEASLVPYSLWFSKLREEKDKAIESGTSDEARFIGDLRALKIFAFWQALSALPNEGGSALGLPQLSCDNAVIASPTLQDPLLPQLGEADVKRWLRYWRKSGLLV